MIRKDADSFRSNPEVIVTHPSVVIENNYEFDVQDNMTFDPTFGDASIIKKTEYNTIKLPNLAAACEREGNPYS